MIALLNLSVLGFSFVVFHDKAERTQQGNLLHLLTVKAKRAVLVKTNCRSLTKTKTETGI